MIDMKLVEALAKAAESGRGGFAAEAEQLDRRLGAYRKTSAGFTAAEAPVERILTMAAERAEPEGAPRQASSRRLLRVAVVAVTLAGLAVAVTVAKPQRPDAQAVISNAMAAIEQPNMITYYKITVKTRTPFGGRTHIEEHWVDHKNEMEKSVSGPEEGKEKSFTLVRDGKIINIEKKGDSIDVGESKAPEPFSDALQESVESFRADIKGGRAKLVGEEVIDGITTYKIRREHEEQDVGRVDDRKLGRAETINFRKDNFLPVRRVYERLLIGPNGERTVDSADVSSYSAIKLVDPATLGSDFFNLDIPKDAPYHYSDTLTMAEAKEFNEFDLFSLDDSFAGFEAPGFFDYHREENQPYSLKGLPSTHVRLVYVELANDGAGGIQLMIWPKFDLSVLVNASYSGGTQTALDINGRKGVLIEKDWGRSVTRVILMQIGRSTIEIHAQEKDTLIRAARGLIKIN